jgi:glycosyltransferase involved in cell wall biosynthesis
MPKFSVIMQSYLGEYQGAAKDRDTKILRAIDSLINQTFDDWELIIIADGCEKTVEIVCKKYEGNKKIYCDYIPKQEFWSGIARDCGKFESKGDYCIYLDIDDYYAPDYLARIEAQLNDYDWVCMNDYILVNGAWNERICNIRRIGMNGTSNVCFKRELEVNWSSYTGYAHDFYFNQQLVKKYPNHAKINTPGYYVCHLPPHPGSKGYDI